MRFTLTIDCDNAAFGESLAETEAEVSAILKRLAAKIRSGEQAINEPARIIDSNGNTVGSYLFGEVR